MDDTLGARLGGNVGDLESTPSDARLKRNITQIATRYGLQIYSFRYLWDGEVRVGVMAQDLLRNEAWDPAVVTKEGDDFVCRLRAAWPSNGTTGRMAG